MKESFFIKSVKWYYGINRPFDEYSEKVVNEAGNKVAVGLITFLLLSSCSSMILINILNPYNVLSGLIFMDLIAIVVASGYMGRLIKKHGFDYYEYDSKNERKACVKNYILSNMLTLIFMWVLLYTSALWWNNVGGFFFVYFVLCNVGVIIGMYEDYRRKFKKA
ncbi:DUF3278 domain-containing protein [Apilactobacillus apinorum]|uniref:DUF3278 domain-containing protein n=1 Tax=Apilactobacillus apinorum TaxID=1218495 RepID=A0ABP9ZHF7_9LACO